MIINIRGTNGAGKSTLVRAIAATALDSTPIYGALGPARPEAYQLALLDLAKPVFVLGPYLTPTGGADLLSYDTTIHLIKKYRTRGHVLFEGVITSTVYGELGKLLKELHAEVVVAFLDTPLEECIARVRSRRQGRGNIKPFDPALVASKHGVINRLRGKFDAAGVRTVSVSSGNPAAILELLLDSEP